MTDRVWIFHRGALGDSVLVWPMMRALRRHGSEVTFVADGAKARLAAAELGVGGLDAEQRRFGELWVEGSRPAPIQGVRRVVSFVADEPTAPGRCWLAGARLMFPDAAIECVPGPVDRITALRLAADGGSPPEKPNTGVPIVLHVGAGSASKRWPMDRWEALAACLGRACVVIAGETEADQFSTAERRVFSGLDGRYLTDLAELARTIKAASVFIGGDTGPTHLAAQLGVPTVALFGPTDPWRWAPIGPRVRVLAPDAGCSMDWLGVDRVLADAGRAGRPADDH